MIKIVIKCILVAIMSSIVFVPFLAFAEWKGPYEVITGTWGRAEGQFYFRAEDTADLFPRKFGVDKDGVIIISDEGNKRIVIYNSDGSLRTIIKKPAKLPEEDATYGWPSGFFVCSKGNVIIVPCEYEKVEGGIRPLKKCLLNYKGEILSKIDMAQVFSNENGFIILKNNIYHRYSPTGQLLETYKERPLEIGVVKVSRGAGRTQKYTVKYDDITYTVKSERIDEQGFQRDTCLNLYLIGRITNPKDIYIDAEWEGNTVSERPIPHYIVTRYGLCDNTQERLHIPANKSFFRKTATGVIRDDSVLRQYGKPIVAHNGDVYCWKRTAKKYTILKWTWQGPPDAPQSLKVTASQKTISLTWQAPTKDANSVKAYEICRSSDVCGPFNKIKKVKKGVLQYTDKEVKEGETYYYQVCAERGSGYSGYSNKAIGSIKD